ncbi:acetate kinase [Oceaniovalibus guishaninsula JLT2003]|uniref:Acetate kinase n=1 Tax=Oceaniovalibus guishaninsula JLT2003 TaxID=1231392 RepID=K2HBH4_9RHOB|nr:acetate kinase [Oceaniovalibus guishaninsula]EKE43972.1 acetate kinase [Oceaniovalibus guishaninsula JLT2003]
MILVVNAGSSSVKCAVFDGDLKRVTTLKATEIGGASRIGGLPADLPDHAAAIEAILTALPVDMARIRVAAHRVVHGGADMTAPVRIDRDVRARIDALSPLAPLHNPVNLAGIDAIAAILPGLPQTASFDTAFHTTIPDVASTYALPEAWRARGLRRYGFHGLSYAALARSLTGIPRLLACHLGNGASLCAIADGRSVATTMGYSPVSGLVMGSRTGDIDAMAVLRMAEEAGIAETGRILNHDSGLTALGGTNDMRRLQADAPKAVEAFIYWAIRHAGSMIAAMGGLDAIAFTGGIGENSAPVRDAIADGLAWAGRVPVHIVPADEEREIARDARALTGPFAPGDGTR